MKAGLVKKYNCNGYNRLSFEWILLYFLALIVIVLSFYYTIISGKQHDYITHVSIWTQILNGVDPWSIGSNTYGPGNHIFIGSWIVFGDMAPKIFYFFCWISLEVALLYNARKNTALFFILILLCNSPLIWAEVFKWGHMEATIGPLVVFCLIFHRNNKDYAAAIFLALAVSIKYVPIVVLPFVIFKERKFRWKFAISFMLTLISIFGYNYWKWGASMISSISHAVDVQSEHMSIFRALRGSYSPLKYLGINNVDFLSLPFMFIGGALIFTIYMKGLISQIRAILCGYLLTLVFYRVGYAQYWMVFFSILFYYFSIHGSHDLSSVIVKFIPLFLPLLFVTFFQCLHAFDLRIFYDSEQIPDWGGNYNGSFRINEWAGYLSLFATAPAVRRLLMVKLLKR